MNPNPIITAIEREFDSKSLEIYRQLDPEQAKLLDDELVDLKGRIVAEIQAKPDLLAAG